MLCYGTENGLGPPLNNKNPRRQGIPAGERGRAFFNRLLHACKEPHKACAASLVHFIDTSIGQYLSEHMAHLVLQDEVHGVAVQFRVAGKNILGPLGVLLQFFRVLAHRGGATSASASSNSFLFQAAGQHGKAHDLDQADVFLF